MCSGVKPVINRCTRMKLNKKLKQWLWFVGLWCAGLLTVTIVGKIIKFFMFSL